tara:strand:+ start:483 stop:785 length:303 start_codon:yes stop_codon:yes gene_type:complete
MSNENEYTNDTMHDDQQLAETSEEEQLREFIFRVVCCINQMKNFPKSDRKHMTLRVDHVEKEVAMVWDMSELELEILDTYLTNKSDIEQHVTVSHILAKG